MTRIYISGAGLISSLLLFLLAGCSNVEAKAGSGTGAANPKLKKSTALEVDAVLLEGKAFTSRIEATGKALLVRESTMSSEVSGKISKIFVKEGERVKKGQALLRFTQLSFNLRVEQARAAVEAARVQVEQLDLEIQRLQRLVGAQAAPEATLDKLKAQYNGSKAQLHMAEVGLKQARKALSDSVLKAPYDGIVTEILHEEGEYAPSMPQTMLITVVDTSSLEIQTFLPEEVSTQVHVGKTVEIVIESAGLITKGEVIFVSNRIKTDSQTFEARIRLENPEGRIKGGAFTRISLERRSLDEALLLPLRAVQRNEDGKAYVFTAEGNRAKRRFIMLGENDGDQVLVIEGLTAGQKVITTQVTEIEDGDPIIIRAAKG